MYRTYFFILTIITFLFFSGAVYAQSEQKIQILEYKGKEQKTALKAVGVTVMNAGATLSDDKGEATLRFRSLKAGDKVTVRRIEKAEYEVFNKQALEQWIISQNSTFKIVLCRSDQFKALREKYMRLSSANYEKQYKRDQNKLAQERKENKLKEEEYQQKLQELEDEYNEQLENLENYVETFSRIDLSEISSAEQQIIALVQEGNIDKAVELYEKYDFLGKYAKETEDIQKIDAATQRLQEVEEQKRQERKEVQQSINRQIATYRLAGGRENFAKITKLLKAMADADLNNFETVTQYVKHARNQHMYEECYFYLKILLDRKDLDQEDQCYCLQFLSQCYSDENRYTECEKVLLQIAEIRMEQGSATLNDLGLLAMAQRDLANFYVNLGMQDEVEKWLEPAITHYEQLMGEEETAYLYWGGMSQLYGNRALVALTEGKTDAAEADAVRSYKIVKQQTLKDDNDNHFMETALNLIGQIYYEQGKWQEQEKYVLELLEFHEKLYQKNPQAYAQVLQGTYNNAAELYMHLEQADKAESYFIKAKDLLQEFDKEEDSLFAFERFCLYDTAAQLYSFMRDRERSQTYAQKALAAYNQLESTDQDIFAKNAESLKRFIE